MLSVFILVALHKTEILQIQLSLQYELYRDPGKGNVIEDSVITSIALIFTRYNLFSMFYLYQLMSTNVNLLETMYIELTYEQILKYCFKYFINLCGSLLMNPGRKPLGHKQKSKSSTTWPQTCNTLNHNDISCWHNYTKV